MFFCERIYLSIISRFIAALISLSIVNFFSKSFLSFDTCGLFILGVEGFDSGDFDLGFFVLGDLDLDFSFAAFLAALATLLYAVSLGSCLSDTFGDYVVISFAPMVSGSESF